ncbi:MAG TPA: LON peptidase substrate-binding domain-containing protein, partial [Pyrinomonadaceae bacterium]
MAENIENTQNTNTGETTRTPGKRFEIPVLPLQNTTLFPDTVVPLNVGRKRSVQAVEAALATEEKLIACISAKSEEVTGNDARPVDLYEVGTL